MNTKLNKNTNTDNLVWNSVRWLNYGLLAKVIWELSNLWIH